MASLNEYTEKLGRTRAAHLLRRSTFGPDINQIQEFENLTPSEAIEILFAEDDEKLSPPIDPKTGQSWVNPPVQNAANDVNSEQDELHDYFKAWHTDVMLKSGTSIRERITWFLHTHLPARWTEIRSSEAIYYQNCLFRHYAFGSFKELFKKICVDNAMLVYLDGYTNHKNDPNENFAREMFELYSIGKGPQIEEGNYTNYTEADIKAATKILTGWELDKTFTHIDAETGLPTGKLSSISQGEPSVLLATGHDPSEKVFSSFYDNRKIAPEEVIDSLPTESASYKELDELIEMIFSKIETARFITRKLYRFFVYHFISGEVENDIIKPLAQQFYDSDYDLQEIITTLLKSEHFYDADNIETRDNNIGALIKSPLELNLGILRFFNLNVPDRQTDANSFYTDMGFINNSFFDQGLNYYEPFEVAGYPAYHQIPAYNRNWITAYSLANRYQVGNILMRKTGSSEGLSFGLDILDWVENSGHISDPSDPDEIISTIMQNLLGVELNQERYNYFLNTVFLDTFDPATWKFEWQNYKNGGDELTVRERLEIFFSRLTQTPEFQLY
mgnify:CR=1 FL=1